MSDDPGTQTTTGEFPQTIGLPNGDFVVFGLTERSACSRLLNGTSYDAFWRKKSVLVETKLAGCSEDVNFSSALFSEGQFLHAFWGKGGSTIERLLVRTNTSASTGYRILDDVPIPSYAADAATNVSVSSHRKLPSDPAGFSLVVWDQYSISSDTGADIFGQFVFDDFTVPEPPFRVASSSGRVQDQPDVALLANGKFAVVWSGVAQLDPAGSDRDVFLRLMDRQLVQSGNEIRVNTKRDGHQSRPAVAALGNDKLVVVWDKAANDPDALAAD